MRTLLLTRGAPGCGKSTWIREHHLENYTLSPDDLRLLCSTPALQPDGHVAISQERVNEQVVWDMLFKILEHRMSRGEFTVVDATASKTKEIQKYRALAREYRYRMYVVDFTDISLEKCLKQNKMRPELKQVPAKAIENIYARFDTQKVPSGVAVIKRDEFSSLLEQPIDLSSYKKLVFIGDIHGCYDTLMQYPDFKDGLKDDTNYIFIGDYIDRGHQNTEVLRFLDKIKDLPNVCLLEGNHERNIRKFGHGEPGDSKEFEIYTRKDFQEKGYTDKEARMFYQKLRQFSHIKFHGLEILACHGGIPNLNNNLLYLPTNNFIYGVGEYKDYIRVAESWMAQTEENQFLVHGHRNTEATETQIADRVFNLQGDIEYGGDLRIVELTDDGNWKIVELHDCQPITEDVNTEEKKVSSVHDAIEYLRRNRCVSEKPLEGYSVSAFNFTKHAFERSIWNKQTIMARGLFINTEKETVAARSYEKFFRIGERRETELSSLKRNLVFPVTAYVKENGFLAIISYDEDRDDLFICSKNTNASEHVKYIHSVIDKYGYRDKLLSLLKNDYNGYSFVFECIDPVHDPHIIKYNDKKLVLLDCIKNDLVFEPKSYGELVIIADRIGCPVKEKAFIIKDWDSFRNLYYSTQDYVYKYKGKYIEGFVFVDSTNFMTKCKTAYYNQWKKLRGVADSTLRCGYILRTGSLTNELENHFYGFCRKLYEKDYNKETEDYPFKTDIISLRDKYFEERGDINE